VHRVRLELRLRVEVSHGTLELRGEEEEVEPEEGLGARVKLLAAVLEHEGGQVGDVVLLLRRVALLVLAGEAELEPHPVLGRDRHPGRLAREVEPSDELVQRVLVLVGLGVVADAGVEVGKQLVAEVLGDAALGGAEERLERAGERPVVREAVHVVLDEGERLGRVPRPQEVVEVRPELDAVDRLGHEALLLVLGA
jgi:hypothetical protein